MFIDCCKLVSISISISILNSWLTHFWLPQYPEVGQRAVVIFAAFVD